MKKDCSSKYLLTIVSIVAVVGIVILVLQGSGKMSVNSEDVAGQASISIPSVSFQTLIFVIDGDALPEDSIMMTNIVTDLYTNGYLTYTLVYLESEVEISSIENKVLIIVRNEEVVIVVPDAPTLKTQRLSSAIQSFVTAEYGTSVTEVAYSDATIDDLD